MARSIIIIPNWVILVMLCFITECQVLIHGEQQVPCLFFMGDSLSDNGNNNDLATLAKANYPPYGVDYPGGPTGRFCNGKMIPDFIAELLGFDKPVPPFATAKGEDVLKGVNYASASAGILDETGTQVGDRISLNRQIQNHRTTTKTLSDLLGPDKVQEHLNKCFYAVYMGSNDYLSNYFLPTSSNKMLPPDQIAAVLFQTYSQQLKDLYNLGARKVAVFGLGGVTGCVPPVLDMYRVSSSVCASMINNVMQPFNNRLKALVDDFNTNLPAAKFTYINISNLSLGLLSLPGLANSTTPCCTVEAGVCTPYQAPCSNRDQYTFFDDFHPTQVVNQYMATRAYKALSPSDAYPFDIQHLVQQ